MPRKEIAGSRREILAHVVFMPQYFQGQLALMGRAIFTVQNINIEYLVRDISFMTATAAFVNSVATFYRRDLIPMSAFYPIIRAATAILLALTMLAPAHLAAQIAPAAAAPAATPDNMLHLDLSTGGRVTIQLYPDIAPAHVDRIKTLARQGFYNGVVFHRVIDGFMAQTGDPTGTGQGGSELPDLKAEFNKLPHLRGTVSMARTNEPDTANSQFFICFQPRFSLDNKYTVFGRVVSGMQYVDAIERGEPPASPSKVIQASIASDNITPPLVAAPQIMTD